MRTQLGDMDLGTWNFTPNALGETVSQTDANAKTTTFGYDPLGRMTTRTEQEGTSTWTWGNSSAARNIGRLESVSGLGYSESYLYDSKGRLATQTINADQTYVYDYGYNSIGGLHTITWPTSTSGVRVKAKYLYTNGRLTQIRQFTGDVDGPNLWSLNLLDAAGRATSEAYGNGLWVQSAFDPLTGQIASRRSGTGGSATNVQQLAYGWDEAGNLETRQDLNQGLTETFIYDALERLTSATGPGGTLTVSYDAIGNIAYRSDVGTYSYHATKKHAVIGAGGNTYSYDANGNMKNRNGKSLTWRSYNLPSLINGVGYSASFSYTPNRQRWRQVSGYASGNETTIYVGALLEKLSTPVRKHWKHRIPTPSGEVQVIRRNDGTSETFYFANDHLGSVDAVLNASGAVVSRPSFNAWGARRGSNWQGAPNSTEWQAIADTTRRGFTGHEQLDNVMLVHMNGRVYEPAIGRFLSADPYVDGAGYPQGWNRYSYVQNRPLSYIDPSGWSTVAVVVTARRWRDGPSYNGGSLGMGVVGSGGDGEPVEATVVVEASRLPPESPPAPPMPPVRSPSSQSAGEPQAQNRDPCAMEMLPQDGERDGYYNYGTPEYGAGQYGLPDTIRLIQDVGAQWQATGAQPFGVGNISLQGGGPFPPHGGHRNGLSFDLRPVRHDGAQVGGTTWTSAAYDRNATQRLVNTLSATGHVRSILFNDPHLDGVMPYENRDDHLHVNVRSTSCNKKN